MNIRRIIPISMLMLAACGPANNRTARETIARPPISALAAEPPAAPTRTISSSSDLRSAISEILATRPRVVAFGEIHKTRASNLTSTLQHYAREVMPVLAEQGFTDLVLEHLPSGGQAAREVEQFNRTGRFGPFLSDWFAFNPDFCGIVEVIRQAHSLGITLHGSHAPSVEEYHANFLTQPQMINSRTVSHIRAILGEGRRVAVYNGTIHNDVQPIPGRLAENFGLVLRRELGPAYAEVDIFLPELGLSLPNAEMLNLPDLSHLVPSEGVTLVQYRGGRSIVILPAIAEPVVHTIPEREPVCN